MNWRSYDTYGPPHKGRYVFVYFPDATQQCHSFDAKYFVPEESGRCWGWYPGGINPHGTFWIPLDEIPKPDLTGRPPCGKLEEQE